MTIILLIKIYQSWRGIGIPIKIDLHLFHHVPYTHLFSLSLARPVGMLDGSAAITEMSGLHSFDFCIFIIVKYLFIFIYGIKLLRVKAQKA